MGLVLAHFGSEFYEGFCIVRGCSWRVHRRLLGRNWAEIDRDTGPKVGPSWWDSAGWRNGNIASSDWLGIGPFLASIQSAVNLDSRIF